MANVSFKRGTEASLQKYLYSYLGTNPAPVQAVEGTFYLTTDTNRLYIGKTVNIPTESSSPYKAYNGQVKAVPVNQGAIPVATVSDLPEAHAAVAGQFYYVVDGNILAVASQGVWVQINPNTNDNDFLSEITTEVNSTTYTDTYRINDDQNHTVEKSVTFEGADSFGVTVTPVYESASIYIPGIDYYTQSGTSPNYTYTKNTSITSASAYNTAGSLYIRKGVKITLTPVSYSVAGNVDNGVGTITLSNNKNATTSTATIQAGVNAAITTSGSGTNKPIIVNAYDTANTAVNVAARTGTGNHGFDISVTQGTMTEATNGAYSYDSNTVSTSANGSTHLDPQIVVGKTGATGVYFAGGIATLPVYTVAEVDNKFTAFNAMHYKGLVSDNQIITNAQIGDVWKVNSGGLSQITYKFQSDPDNSSTAVTKTINVSANVGDLLIFNSSDGTEDATTGYLTTTLATVEIIPSGDEIDTVSTASAYSTTGVTLNNKAGAELPAPFVHLVVAANTCLSAARSSAADATSGEDVYTWTVSHNTKTPTTTTASQQLTDPSTATPLTITVPTITWDDYGHVATVTNTPYIVNDTHAQLTNAYAITQDTVSNAAVNKLTVTNTVGDATTGMSSNSAAANFGITSDTITLSTTTTSGKAYVVMDIVWGSF